MNLMTFLAVIFFLLPIAYQISQIVQRLRNKTSQRIGFIYLMTIFVGVIFALLSSFFLMNGLTDDSKKTTCVNGIQMLPVLLITAIFILASLISIIGLLIKYIIIKK